MKTYPITSNRGILFSFEIESVYVSIKDVVMILKGSEYISKIKKRKIFDIGNEYHVEFEFHGIPCVVWEPFGDSSRYWVGPKDRGEQNEEDIDISCIEKLFAEYRPSWIMKILGDVVSLNFIKKHKDTSSLQRRDKD